jgi:hypothetical protein
VHVLDSLGSDDARQGEFISCRWLVGRT